MPKELMRVAAQSHVNTGGMVCCRQSTICTVDEAVKLQDIKVQTCKRLCVEDCAAMFSDPSSA